MPRPRCCRRIASPPLAEIFKPAGIPSRQLEEISLTLDELEAVRLADLEGLYQAEAAQQMGISRPTFSRIIEAAHRKVAAALVLGKALRIHGGPVALIQGTEAPCCHPAQSRGAGSGPDLSPGPGPENLRQPGRGRRRRRRRWYVDLVDLPGSKDSDAAERSD